MGVGASGSPPMDTKRTIITKDNPEWAKSNKSLGELLAREKASDQQWFLIDMAIKAFISKYPTQWYEFKQQLKTEETEFQLATKEHKELRKRGWRNSATFPIVYLADGDQDSLLPVLNKIIPGLTHKKSRNFGEFLKRYPIFCPSIKSNHGEF